MVQLQLNQYHWYVNRELVLLVLFRCAGASGNELVLLLLFMYRLVVVVLL